ncbi:MAG: hypothetical protein JO180_06250 [Gemmatirosa sp.]|nr:hypothetical protein [Gemmatirosa sp.]
MGKLLLGALLLAAVAVATCTVAAPWRRELRFKRLGDARPVDLNGFGTVQLAPTFHATPGGRGDAHGLTFRFEQGQHTVLGGYRANPVLLDVTLLAPPDGGAAAPRVDHTTIEAFYPPVDDRARLAAHFAAQRWLPDPPDPRDPAGAVTRVAATNEGRGDDLSSGPPERWLAIHLDPARRVRVDLYAWRSAYSADEARALVRAVAASATPTPRLDARLAELAAAERRRAERSETAPVEAAATLRRCGIARLTPGETAVGTTCAAHLTADGRRLRVAALLGRVPLAASRGTPGQVPQFALAPGAPDLGATLLWWDGARWAAAGLQATLSGDDLSHPVLDAVAARLHDRASVLVLRTFWIDFQHHPDGVERLAPFLAEAGRQAGALAEGTLLPGVRGTEARFDRE